jgi:hypothetical protein
MNVVYVGSNGSWKRVAVSPCIRFPRAGVLEGLVIGCQQIIGLRDGNRGSKPIASSGWCCSHVVGR